MELKNLNSETKELIKNALGIYYALKNQSKLYRSDGMLALSLYVGVLRLGTSYTITKKIPLTSGPGTGYPWPDGIRPDTSREKIEYRYVNYDYENKVCQILNEYGMTIEQVLALLHLDEQLSTPVKHLRTEKMEKQYNVIYKVLLETICKYYIASAKEANKNRTYYTPKIEMSIPIIISAIHYPNIDSTNSIKILYQKLMGIPNLPSSMPDYLKEIEKEVTCSEELGKRDKNGNLKLSLVKTPIVMNPEIGKII